jgi:hypothetical protein
MTMNYLVAECVKCLVFFHFPPLLFDLNLPCRLATASPLVHTGLLPGMFS